MNEIFSNEVRLVAAKYNSRSVAVLTCGPEKLTFEVQQQSMKFGYNFHKETFLL